MMFGMDSSFEEVGPIKGTILALLDFLVDPLLPSKSLSKEALSSSQEEMVAKQVHAVVLLYNYYHRRRHPRLEFLDFTSFCKMAVLLKPTLLSYMRLMQRPDCAELDDDLDNQLSMTEKTVMNACDVSKSLDASNNYPIIEGWPIKRVAVFLVDSNKENCYLFHSSMTQGVWSVIERDVNVPSHHSSEAKRTKKVTKRPSKENQSVDEAALQHHASLAVREACGIYQGYLKYLENHTVYSISKEKTAVRLYIMQCTQANQEDVNLVPINDAIDSLRGPLVRKECGSWITTPVVEYFHLLPFADKITDWLSREGLLDTSQLFEAAEEHGNCDSSHIEVDWLSNTCPHFEPLPNTSNHLGDVKEVGNGDSSQPDPLQNSSDNFGEGKDVENCNNSLMEPLQNTSENHFEEVKVEVEPPMPITTDHFGVVKEVGICHSSQVAPLPKTSENCGEVEPISTDHSGAVKEFGNRDSSQAETPLKSSENCGEMEEVGNHNSSLVEKLPSTSENCGKVKGVDNSNSSLVELEPQPITIDHFGTVKEAGNCNISQVEPLPNTTNNLGEAKEVGNSSLVEVKVEPFSITSDHFEGLVKEVGHCDNTLNVFEAEKEVGNFNNSYLKEEPLNILQPFEVAKDVTDGNSCHLNKEALPYVSQQSEVLEEVFFRRREDPTKTVVYKKRKRSQKNSNSGKNTGSECTTSNANREYSKQEDEECAVTGSSNTMDIDESFMTCSPVQGKSLILSPEHHVEDQKQMIVVAQAQGILPSSHAHNGKTVLPGNNVSDTVMSDQAIQALIAFDSNFEHLHKVHLTIASKDKLLSETALKVLYKKRDILTQQLRSVADEIALCDRNIDSILSGNEDDLAVKIDSIIEGCNDIYMRGAAAAEDRTRLHLRDQDFPQSMKRKRLSEANLCLHNPCQDLDDICSENGWILPTCHVSAAEGGFQASVTVKGVDFECSTEGAIRATPHEARNSAASTVLVKLQNMAAKS